MLFFHVCDLFILPAMLELTNEGPGYKTKCKKGTITKTALKSDIARGQVDPTAKFFC